MNLAKEQVHYLKQISGHSDETFVYFSGQMAPPF